MVHDGAIRFFLWLNSNDLPCFPMWVLWSWCNICVIHHVLVSLGCCHHVFQWNNGPLIHYIVWCKEQQPTRVQQRVSIIMCVNWFHFMFIFYFMWYTPLSLWFFSIASWLCVYFMSNVMPFFYLVFFHHLLVLCSCVHIMFNVMPASYSLSIIGVMVSFFHVFSYFIGSPTLLPNFFLSPFGFVFLCLFSNGTTHPPPPRFFFIISWSCFLMFVFCLM